LKRSFIDYLPFISEHPLRGGNKYIGSVATGYDAKRMDEPKWAVEQSIIESWIDQFLEGSTVLDAPIGTGRFLKAYARRKLNVYGLDRSGDMLNEAKKKLPAGLDIKFCVGDVRDTQLPDKSVDAALNIRITRWLTPQDCQQMMREMQRVSRSAIIWTARVANHKHARPRELFEQALDGWKITRDVAGHVPDYRILFAEPSP
jgi:ubiquinone/menaquinone biosynthesis C-methylase UbiE